MRKWQIWCEGQAGSKDFGEDFKAHLMGEIDADSFEQACDTFFATHPESCYYRKCNGILLFWALQLHDNEVGARRANG